MEQYNVTGMSCAACSAHVEKAVQKVSGVTNVSVSLLTNSMVVEGNAVSSDVIEAVEKAGYGASLKSTNSGNTLANGTRATEAGPASDAFKDRETPILKRRLISSLIFLVPLMYISMGHMMWNWPLPESLASNCVGIGLIQLLLTIAIMIINQKFFVNGFTSFMRKAPNMDTLVALGAGAAFVYSVYALFAMSGAQAAGDSKLATEFMHEFYFESAAMILTLITVGKMLEARSKGKTTDALKSLMDLAPKMAKVIRDNEELEVLVEEVRLGDIFVVRPGESIPVDGCVIEGSSAVDEAALTGESIPVDKEAGDSVSAATINRSGFLKCEATRVGENTTLAQIIKMVSDAAATKAPIAKVADKVSGIFVPAVITIALVTILVWLVVGETVGFALARGISVLVISCPCALGLATPVAIMVGSGVGARNGILFKTASSLEETGKVQVVALDKTGTITSGKPTVTDIIPADKVNESELVNIAYSLEIKSEHPLAHAIVEYGNENGITAKQIDDFTAIAGNGLSGKCGNNQLFGGNLKFIESKALVSGNIKKQAEELAKKGKTPLFFAQEDRFLGIIAVADVLKEDSAKAISELKNMGIKVVMLTGDNQKTADAIGAKAGVDQVIAGVLPDGKENVIKELSKYGKVAMVGDGINDALALTRADIGIAIGAGTDVAIDAADVVLMKNSLMDVSAAIRLSRNVLKNIHQNLFWAFFYNTIGIPVAAGVLIPMFALKLNPMFGAAAMSLSSFCVVSNALRLNFVNIRNSKWDKKISSKNAIIQNEELISEATENQESGKEVNKMERTMNINGMMCGHCEARVKKCLEALEEVETAVVSHENGTAVVTLKSEISDEVLKSTVEAQDYEVVSIN